MNIKLYKWIISFSSHGDRDLPKNWRSFHNYSLLGIEFTLWEY